MDGSIFLDGWIHPSIHFYGWIWIYCQDLHDFCLQLCHYALIGCSYSKIENERIVTIEVYTSIENKSHLHLWMLSLKVK